MDLGYKKLLGGGTFKHGPRPDVGILFKDGTIKVIEVASKTDIDSFLRQRNLDFMRNNGIIGDIRISHLAVYTHAIKGKLSSLLNLITSKCK